MDTSVYTDVCTYTPTTYRPIYLHTSNWLNGRAALLHGDGCRFESCIAHSIQGSFQRSEHIHSTHGRYARFPPWKTIRFTTYAFHRSLVHRPYAHKDKATRGHTAFSLLLLPPSPSSSPFSSSSRTCGLAHCRSSRLIPPVSGGCHPMFLSVSHGDMYKEYAWSLLRDICLPMSTLSSIRTLDPRVQDGSYYARTSIQLCEGRRFYDQLSR